MKVIRIKKHEPKVQKKSGAIKEWGDLYRQQALYLSDYLNNLKEPKTDLKIYLENLGSLRDADDIKLQKYMGVFTSWQNYLAESLVVADSVVTVAESQRKSYYSSAVEISRGKGIQEKKEYAYADSTYKQAEQVALKAKSIYDAISVKFENCERGFRLISRIISIKTRTKEYDKYNT